MKMTEVFKNAGDMRELVFLSPNKWFMLFVGLYAVSTGLTLLAGHVPGGKFYDDNGYFTSLLFYPAVVLSASLVVLKKIGVDFRAAGNNWILNFRRDFMLAGVYFLGVLLLVELLKALGLGGYMQSTKSAEVLAALQIRPGLLFPLVLSAVVIGPVGEEIFFKRLLYVGVRRQMPAWRAIALCTVLFALIHPISAFLQIIISALVSYYMYERHQRLQANVIYHALLNLSVVLGQFL